MRSVIVGAQWDSPSLPQVLEVFAELGPEYAPRYAQLGENDPKKRWLDVSETMDVIPADWWLLGLSLRAPRVVSDVECDPDGLLRMRVGARSDEEAEWIYAGLVSKEPLFAFAADAREEEHRNFLRRKTGASTMEAAVGRRASRYVPGLYWRTYLSRRLVQLHGVRVSGLFPEPMMSGAQPNGYAGVAPFPSAAWRTWATVTDRFCQEEAGFFSLVRVHMELEGVADALDAVPILSKYL